MTAVPTISTGIVAGLLIMGQVIAALFFSRFYRDTRDRLFLYFAAAFTLLALQRLGLTMGVVHGVDPMWYYGARLLAFLIILAGILDKNRPTRR